MRTLVVIPTFNERDSLPHVVGGVLELTDADVLVVDDSSPDGTGVLADELAARHERVQVLHRSAKRGLGAAYRAGLGWGLERGYEVLVEMDADRSHDPTDLPAILTAVTRADLAIGSRYVPGGAIENWPWHRRMLSAGGNRYVQLVTGLPVQDATSGYRAYRREVLTAIDIVQSDSEGYAFQLEAVLKAWRSGFGIEEVPIRFVERRSGASKISRAVILEAVWRVLWWGIVGPRRPGEAHPRSVGRTG